MTKTIKISSIILVGFLLGWFLFLQMDYGKAKVKIRNVEFVAEKAETPVQREKGLGGRKELCEKCAMLFLFGSKGRYSFWMKDMKFDIDIIWINDGRITYIKKDAPYDSLESFYPSVQADRVLEIRSGSSEKYGFMVGDTVQIN